MKEKLAIFGSIPGIFWGLPALADATDRGGYYYGHPMWSGGWGGMFVGWGMMAIFMIAVMNITSAKRTFQERDEGKSSEIEISTTLKLI